jgi:hypothetical protein
VGGLAEMTGEYERAAALHRDGLRWAEELALWPEVGSKLSWLAWLAVQTRDYPQARELAERAYRLAVEQDAPAAVVFAKLSLGIAARRDGKLDVAVQHLEHLRELAGRDGDAEHPALYLPMVLIELGYAAEQRGADGAGAALHLAAFDAAQAMASPRDTAGALDGLASAAAAAGHPAAAARLLGAAAAARSAAGVPASSGEQDEIDRVSAVVQAALGRAAFEAGYAAGRELGPAQARAVAEVCREPAGAGNAAAAGEV